MQKDEPDRRLEAPEGADHSFVVRLWKEARDRKDNEPFWRGSVEHVETGNKQYLLDLHEIFDFVVFYIGKGRFGCPTEKGENRRFRPKLPANLNLKSIRRLWRSAV